MSLGKKLFIGSSAAGACPTDSVQPFGADSAYSSNVALYQLDGNANDTVGNHNSTASNVTYSTGKFGQCAVFNGSSQYITTGVDSSDISMTNTSFSCWVNFTATSGTIMDNGGAASTGRGLILETGSGYIVWQQANGTGGQSTSITSASNSYNDGNWHHVVGTIDGNRVMKLYIDGNVESSTPTANSSATSPLYTLEIGRRAFYNSQYFNGKIDQVRIFQKALSQNEIDTLYAETACVYTPTTDNNDYPVTNAAYYKLDNNAEDAKGSYDGAESNITYEFGRFGQAAVFNGSSSYITTGVDSSDISMTNTSFSCWVNFTATSGTIMDNGGAASTGRGLILETGSGYIVWQQANGTGGQSTSITSASNSYNDGNWHHVVGTIDGNRVMKLYIDGNVESSTPTANSSATSPLYTLEIGRRAFYNSQYFNGSIDQVRIFNRALDGDEVFKLYAEHIN